MNRARSFFYVCAGLLLLALSWHLGARSAGAQATGNPVVGVSSIGNGQPVWLAVTANGDTYYSANTGQSWQFSSNVFAGGPTPAREETWGQLKSRYREPAVGR